LNYSEKETLRLTDDLLIGVGSERKCYLHPEDKEKCVKIVHKFGPRTKARCKREIKYSFKYSRLAQKLSSIPRYYGGQRTNLGQGQVFELILNYDGTISDKLSEHTKTSKANQLLYTKITDLYSSFIEFGIVVSDFHAENIVVRKKNALDFELVLIDGYGNSDFLKIADHISFFRKKKLLRKFNRLLSPLHLPPLGTVS